MRLSQFTLEQAADSIYWVDSAARIYRVNEAACKLFGSTENELTSLTIFDISPDYDKKSWQEYWNELKRLGVLQFETYLKNRQGNLIPVEIRANRIEFEGKELACHFVRDITRRKQIEDSLRKSEANLAEAQRLAHVGSWDWNIVTNGLYWSDEIYRIFGLTPQEFGATYDTFLTSVHPDDREFVVKSVDEALNEKKLYDIEHRIVLPNGEARIVHEHGEVGYNDDGKPVRMIGTVQDITEFRWMEDSLRVSETGLKLAQKLAHIGSWDWDFVTQKIFWSDEVYRIFGFDPKEANPSVERLMERVHPDDRESVKKAIDEAFQGKKSGGIEYRIILPNGKERTLFRLFEVIYDKANKPIRMIGTVQDITERKNAENKINRLNRLYSVLSEINQTIVRVRDTRLLYDEVCRIAIEKGGFRMAWVGVVDEKSGQVKAVSSAGVVDGYLDNIKINIRDASTGGGPTGTCIIQNRHNICTDFENDPRMAPWRENALKRDYRSSAAFPLSIDGKVIGAFALYSSEVGFFNNEEVKLLLSLAEDICFALESIQKEKLLIQTEKQYRMLFDSMPDTFALYKIIYDSNGKVIDADLVDMNSSALARLKIKPEEIIGKPIRQVIPQLPVDFIQTMADVAESGKPLVFEFDSAVDDISLELHLYSPEKGQCALIGKDITERKKAAENLKAERQRLYDVLETLPVYVVLLAPDYHVPFANRFFRERYGEAHGRRCYEYLFNRTEPCEFCETYKVLKTNTPLNWEWVAPDGRIYDIFDFPFLETDGSSLILEMGIDITERKKAVAALQASEARLNLAQQMAHIGSWDWDLVTQKISWSDEVYRIFGFDPKEVSPNIELFMERTHPDDKEAIKKVIDKDLLGEKTGGFEFRITLPGAKILTIFRLSELILDKANKPIKMIGTVQDITERKRAEEALGKSEANLAQAQRMSHIGSWEWDLKTNEVFWSDELYRIYGLDPEGPGATLESALKGVHPDDREAHRLDLNGAITNKKPYKNEHRIVLQDGQVRIVLGLGEATYDEAGEPIRMVGTLQDITERKKAEENLRTALDEVHKLKAQLQAENIYLQEEIKIGHNFDHIISHNDTLKKALRKVEQVASTDTTALILGETGTGKELFARAIHNISNRRDRPLVKVNCAALPPTLIESELFGHEKGAFTGAMARKIGRFELADKGTLFLDEIGDLPLDLQAKFLRVLQDGEFERVGGTTTIKADVRIIAATNLNLEEAVKTNRFREDLYYRINVFPIQIIPLRERKDDIPILVNHFVKKYGGRIGKKIDSVSQQAMEILRAYSWPGNVRELENVIEHAIILCDRPTIQIDDFPSISANVNKAESTGHTGLKDIEKDFIVNILKECNWIIDGIRGAAARLEIAPSSLRDRMKKLGIKRPK